MRLHRWQRMLAFFACTWVITTDAALIYSTYDGTNAGSGYAQINYLTINPVGQFGNRFAAAGPAVLGRNRYRLSHITLNMERISGAESNLIVEMYTDGIYADPFMPLGRLYSTIPIDGRGNYNFYPTNIIHLQGSYYSVVVQPSLVDGTYYGWSYNDGTYSDGGWYSEVRNGNWNGWEPSTETPAILVYGLPLSESLAAIVDLDGDVIQDLNVYWPKGGNWYVRRSWNNVYFGGGPQNWGWSQSLPVPGDYDADAQTDLAVYFPTRGQWYIRKSSDGVLMNGGPIPFGTVQTIPVPGDYDGDGKTDLAVYYSSAGQWYVASSTAGFQSPQWGWSESIPVPGDYDGDGVTDVAVYHPGTGIWYIRQSSNGQLRQQQWGWSEAEPTPMDYDGDGRTDISVYHPASGNWYILKSSTGSLRQRQWGWGETLPVPGDYDGGGKSDLAVYYPATGLWYIRSTETGELIQRQWGWSEALPTDNQLRINRTFGFRP